MPILHSSASVDSGSRQEDGLVVSMSELIALGNQVQRLNLDVTAGARSILAGAHLSRFRGRGMDYAESREYQPGDDVRHIDWRVTARTGRTHTKLYVEERERPVFVILDFSPSMYFGTRGALKSVTASRAAAGVAWSVVHRGDRVGAVLATPSEIRDQRPAAGRRGVLNIIRQLAQNTEHYARYSASQSGPRLADALEHAARVVHPGSLILIFSDFYQHTDAVRKLLARIGMHNDIVACQVLDTIERSLPVPGRYPVTDGIHQQVMDIRGAKAREHYQQMLAERDRGLGTLLRGLQIPLVRIVGSQSVTQSLVDAFGRKRPGSAHRTNGTGAANGS